MPFFIIIEVEGNSLTILIGLESGTGSVGVGTLPSSSEIGCETSPFLDYLLTGAKTLDIDRISILLSSLGIWFMSCLPLWYSIVSQCKPSTQNSGFDIKPFT